MPRLTPQGKVSKKGKAWETKGLLIELRSLLD